MWRSADLKTPCQSSEPPARSCSRSTDACRRRPPPRFASSLDDVTRQPRDATKRHASSPGSPPARSPSAMTAPVGSRRRHRPGAAPRHAARSSRRSRRRPRPRNAGGVAPGRVLVGMLDEQPGAVRSRAFGPSLSRKKDAEGGKGLGQFGQRGTGSVRDSGTLHTPFYEPSLGYYPGTEEAHTNPTRQRGECLRALAGASG